MRPIKANQIGNVGLIYAVKRLSLGVLLIAAASTILLPRISVSLDLQGSVLTIDIADDGIAFNRLKAKPPNLDLPITERPINGLGIHIVRALRETIAYRRENGRNHLTITMRV
jgi:hypothetical protein